MSIWDTIVAPIEHIIDKVIPDKAANDAAKAALEELRESDQAKQIEQDVQLQLAALSNVQAEEKGESWLQRNWRPIVALFLTGLVGSYWFGWTAPNLTPASIDDLFGLVKICLGGYYAGRSVEKIAPHVVEAVKAFKG
jgi:Holin of 3TMs, for gene-transfer release